MSTDAHDRMIRAFQEYFKWQDRFHYRGSDASGIKARFWLSEIRQEASILRKEIQAIRDQRRIARNGQVGRPKKAT
jgi:hypothetical protein